jgi:ribosomal protein S24E
MGRGGSVKLQVQKRVNSKLLDREYVEFSIENKAGKVTRKEAIEGLAKELGVSEENVGLIRLEEQSGRASVVGRFYVYATRDSKKRLHPRYLDERSLTKEERQKLRQERKKAKAPAPPAEAKK